MSELVGRLVDIFAEQGGAAWLAVGWLAAGLVALALFWITRVVLDRLLDDDLPESTASWLRRLLGRCGLEGRVDVVTGPTSAAAFFPGPDLIVCDPRTYKKRDPFFWAIGAHELAHALVHTRVALLGRPLFAIRAGRRVLGSLVRGLIVANIVFGNPALGELVHGGIGVMVIAGLFVVLEELIASVVGLIILWRHGDVGARGILGACVGLLVALATYSAAVAADIAVYLHFDAVIEPLFAASFTPGAGSGWLATTALIIATIAIAFGLLQNTVALTLSPEQFLRVSDLPIGIGSLVFVALTFDQTTGDLGQALAGVALVAVGGGLVLLATTAIGRVIGLVIRRFRIFWLADRLRARAEDQAMLSLASVVGSKVTRVAAWIPRASIAPFVLWYWIS